jgi:protein disulfide isomerase
MFKLSPFLLLSLIICSLINNSNAEQNSTDQNETLKNVSNVYEKDENNFYYDPFKDFDFGNLIWLDDTNATSEIKKYDYLYVLFYSPWCQHCHIFLPEYVKVSKYAAEKNLTIKFAKIDSARSMNITEDFKVQGFPSIYLITKTEKYLYEGDRTKEGLIKFFNRKKNNDVTEVDSVKQIKDYINSNTSSPIVLLCTLRHPETVLYQSFLNYSKINQNIDFLLCTKDECLVEYRQDIVLFKKFDEKINKYTIDVGLISEAKIDSVKNFVGTYGFETGAVLNSTEISMMFEHKRKMLFYFRNSSLESQTKYDKVIKELGKEFRTKNIYTVVADITGSSIHQSIASAFVIVPRDLPTILFYDLKANSNESDSANIYSIRSVTKEQLTKEYIKEYIKNIKKGKIKKDLFSEPSLDNYDLNGVRYVIGRNYDKHVIEEKNNVLIMFFEGSMICNECDKILGIMRNLTKKYHVEEKKIIFSYFDAGKNQPRDIILENETIPLILLYTNAMEEKKIIKFAHKNFTEINEGEMEDFLSENLKWKKEKNKKKTFKSEEIKIENLKEEIKKKDEKEEAQTDL